MKFVIVGGTGFIGSRVVTKLVAAGHEVVSAAPSNGINSVTGEGLSEAMAGAHAVLDVTNSPTFDPDEILDFFHKSTSNQLAAEKEEHVRHHVVLSIVGMGRLPDNPYLKGKALQENLVEGSGVPFTIIRATQFMEYLGTIADHGGKEGATHISTGNVQVIAASDLVDAIIDVLTGDPANGVIQIAGPEREPMSDVVARYLKAKGDTRRVVAEADAIYFGSRLEENTLVPEGKARLGHTTFSEWIATSV
jgi:uncharacterized protein YbjT (DUF2867 family)